MGRGITFPKVQTDVSLFNALGEEFHPGEDVATRCPLPYGDGTIAKARRNHECKACRAAIPEGTYHASLYYDHFCLDCVTKDRRATEEDAWRHGKCLHDCGIRYCRYKAED